MKQYKLLGPSGETYLSDVPGQFGGNSIAKIYGCLDCSAANAALTKGYASHRVFFLNEQAAIDAGYRPCCRCLRDAYKVWKAGPMGNQKYVWKCLP